MLQVNFFHSTYLIVDTWLGNMSDARSISSRIKACLSESKRIVGVEIVGWWLVG
jgi:hypothetical protein